MRILFVGSWYPYPPDNGARIRSYNLIKELNRRHQIWLLSFFEGAAPLSPERLVAMRQFCGQVDAVPRLDYSGRSISAVSERLRLRPPWITLRWNAAMNGLVDHAIKIQDFDLVILSQVQNLPLLDAINFTTPVLLEQFEVSRIWSRVESASGLRRGQGMLTRSVWTHYLKSRLRECAGITVPSAAEQHILSSLMGESLSAPCSVELIPNGVDLELFQFTAAAPEPDILVYQGSLEFDVNYDAVAFFQRKILPLISLRRPDVRLRVTGRTDGVDLGRLEQKDRLEFTGYLADVRPAVSSAWACVIPLRQGAGTRLKVLEAMALGTPVVTTHKGIEGIDAVHGEHALIADDPRQFADYVVQLLDDSKLRARLAANGRRLVEERYGWEQIGARLSAFCEQVAGG